MACNAPWWKIWRVHCSHLVNGPVECPEQVVLTDGCARDLYQLVKCCKCKATWWVPVAPQSPWEC